MVEMPVGLSWDAQDEVVRRLEEFRFAVPYRWAVRAAVVIHAALLVLFWALDAWVLMWFNAVSVPLYVACALLANRGRFLTAYALGYAEILVHQVLCVHYLGWDSGFQYYIVAVSIFAFLVPTRRYGPKVAAFALSVVVFLGLRVLYREAAPIYPIDPRLLATMGDANAVVALLVLGLIGYYYTRATDLADEALAAEHAKSEALLHNILPRSIAERLKREGRVISDGFEEASILFADIVGFTRLTERLPPEALTTLLDGVFSGFDEIVDRHGLEKIKTIGDAYMVASGVPEPRPDHAPALARAALEMYATLRDVVPAGIDLTMRVGMHAGPVVAGVIGKRKFVYDLWGDTVNTAARMESHGIPGRIQVTEAMRRLLEGEFVLEERGTIEVKGKGPMRTWLLVDRRPAC